MQLVHPTEVQAEQVEGQGPQMWMGTEVLRYQLGESAILSVQVFP